MSGAAEPKTWGELVGAMHKIERTLLAHAVKDDLFHAEIQKTVRRQGWSRLFYFVLTLAAIYGNTPHAQAVAALMKKMMGQ
jgi:hypothetical protein